ncbi:hypothetical protein RAN3_2232 [plant metagenome]|uniref:Uncharacterized protein n=1 Tax=plant metagenome TaxID=1297885 RepID=A0A484U192_9ZZZZ
MMALRGAPGKSKSAIWLWVAGATSSCRAPGHAPQTLAQQGFRPGPTPLTRHLSKHQLISSADVFVCRALSTCGIAAYGAG